MQLLHNHIRIMGFCQVRLPRSFKSSPPPFKSQVSAITNIHTNTVPFFQLIVLKVILIEQSGDLFGSLVLVLAIMKSKQRIVSEWFTLHLHPRKRKNLNLCPQLIKSHFGVRYYMVVPNRTKKSLKLIFLAWVRLNREKQHHLLH